MKCKLTKADLDHWRRQAEDRLACDVTKTLDLPEGVDSVRVLHELLVHQVELELQNEELLESRADLEAHAQLFTELYDFAPVGYLSLSSDCGIRQLNLMAARMLGRDRSYLVNSSILDFVSTDHQRLIKDFVARIFGGEHVEPCEVRFFRLSEAPAMVRLTGPI